MVTITNFKGERLTVPTGAFREIFKPQGWVKEGDTENEPKNDLNSEKDETLSSEENPDLEPSDESQDESEEVNEDEESSDETNEEEDLSEIPLSEMSVPQLNEYAKQLGIDTKKVSGAKALKEAIRKAQK